MAQASSRRVLPDVPQLRFGPPSDIFSQAVHIALSRTGDELDDLAGRKIRRTVRLAHAEASSVDDYLSLLRAYADQAAIAIETSQLFERVETQKQELERANLALREANECLEQRLQGNTDALRRTQREIARLRGAGVAIARQVDEMGALIRPWPDDS